ncbi:MAG TPA: hypothetical protein VGJ09_15985, partial [Bryobacteraceae bacterium]
AEMVEKGTGGHGPGIDRRLRSTRISRIPIEWMDPMSWRLPSGKDLAEFALQAGFLAPLMLERPNLKRRKAPVQAPPTVAEQRVTEVPASTGSFRGYR